MSFLRVLALLFASALSLSAETATSLKFRGFVTIGTETRVLIDEAGVQTWYPLGTKLADVTLVSLKKGELSKLMIKTPTGELALPLELSCVKYGEFKETPNYINIDQYKEGDTLPLAKSYAPIKFPESLKGRKVEYSVNVELKVSPMGEVTEVNLPPGTSEDVVTALRSSMMKWTFSKGVYQGRPTGTTMSIPCSFVETMD